MQERSKRCRHDLQMYGGKAAVLADHINRWLDSLWQGRTLAFTVAVLSALAAFAFLLAARKAHPESDADIGQEDGRT